MSSSEFYSKFQKTLANDSVLLVEGDSKGWQEWIFDDDEKGFDDAVERAAEVSRDMHKRGEASHVRVSIFRLMSRHDRAILCTVGDNGLDVSDHEDGRDIDRGGKKSSILPGVALVMRHMQPAMEKHMARATEKRKARRKRDTSTVRSRKPKKAKRSDCKV